MGSSQHNNHAGSSVHTLGFIKETPLVSLHQKAGAHIVDFAGYMMPLYYTSIVAEHQAVRQQCGVFDICHMGEILIEGNGSRAFLDYVITNDMNKLMPGKALYTPLCRETGGIIDDIIVYQIGDTAYMCVVNASNHEKVFSWLQSEVKHQRDIHVIDITSDTGLLAVQGPASFQLIDTLLHIDCHALGYFHSTESSRLGFPCRIARTGYTGEDGVEIFVSQHYVVKLWETLLTEGSRHNIKPIGLGARDTLRLEMAYSLYGHELTDDITPLEADLAWTIHWNKGLFIGKESLLAQKKNGIPRKLAGFELRANTIARNQNPIIINGKKVGWVSSGTFSPTLQKSIGLGYIPTLSAQIGQEIEIEVRPQKLVPAIVVEKPFYRKYTG